MNSATAALIQAPADLAELDQWVVWRSDSREGKATKVPYQPNGTRAKSDDPTTWSSFETAIDAAAHFNGIGFVFCSDDPYSGIDLDDCLDESGALKAWAQPIIERFWGTYAEVSPSGRGIKIWVRGTLPSGHRINYHDGKVEIYSTGRFFTVTGNVFANAPSQIEEHQADLEWLLRLVSPADRTHRNRPEELATSVDVPQGQRHKFLMSYAAWYESQGMSKPVVLATVRGLNATFKAGPKPDAEVEQIVNDVFKRPSTKGERLRDKNVVPISSGVPSAPAEWRDKIITNDKGVPRALLANAELLLRHADGMQGVLSFSDFSLDIVIESSTPWGSSGRWSDNDSTQAAVWLQREHGVHVSSVVAAEAALTVARDRSFHPVRKYLDGLRWDGTKRIDQWLSLYLGAENTEYTRAVGERWLRSAVARVDKPGSKADCCLILEGEQGIKKSTALRTIAGPWFTDEISDLGSKDAAMQTRGVWIIEIAELDSMSRTEVGRVKAFMSRSVDRLRPPYGRTVIESPRQCIFAGSVNHSTYLRDETGGRRFWPVACTTIRIEELTRDRDQLWAEAIATYRAGAVWWLDSAELNRVAEEEQASRYESDPWEERLVKFLSERDSASVGEFLAYLGKPEGQWNRADEMRVASCFRTKGWDKYRAEISGIRYWRYRNSKRGNE